MFYQLQTPLLFKIHFSSLDGASWRQQQARRPCVHLDNCDSLTSVEFSEWWSLTVFLLHQEDSDSAMGVTSKWQYTQGQIFSKSLSNKHFPRAMWKHLPAVLIQGPM